MNPLEQLKDIHAAPDPGIWPLAPGWWLLMVLIILLIATAVYAIRRYRSLRRRRAILKEFESVFAGYQNHSDSNKLAAQLHRLIRRMMLANGERQQLGLTGEAFLSYLDQSSDDQLFTQGIGRVLLDAPYRPKSSFDVSALHAVVMQWARQQVGQVV